MARNRIDIAGNGMIDVEKSWNNHDKGKQKSQRDSNNQGEAHKFGRQVIGVSGMENLFVPFFFFALLKFFIMKMYYFYKTDKLIFLKTKQNEKQTFNISP